MMWYAIQFMLLPTLQHTQHCVQFVVPYAVIIRIVMYHAYYSQHQIRAFSEQEPGCDV